MPAAQHSDPADNAAAVAVARVTADGQLLAGAACCVEGVEVSAGGRVALWPGSQLRGRVTAAGEGSALAGRGATLLDVTARVEAGAALLLDGGSPHGATGITALNGGAVSRACA